MEATGGRVSKGAVVEGPLGQFISLSAMASRLVTWDFVGRWRRMARLASSLVPRSQGCGERDLAAHRRRATTNSGSDTHLGQAHRQPHRDRVTPANHYDQYSRFLA